MHSYEGGDSTAACPSNQLTSDHVSRLKQISREILACHIVSGRAEISHEPQKEDSDQWAPANSLIQTEREHVANSEGNFENLKSSTRAKCASGWAGEYATTNFKNNDPLDKKGRLRMTVGLRGWRRSRTED